MENLTVFLLLCDFFVFTSIFSLKVYGGNSIRYWLFVEGDSIPAWDENGYVIGTDYADSLISGLLYSLLCY